MGSRAIKKRMIIRGGRVHGVGCRPLLLGIAESLGIWRFSAENLVIDGVEAVEVLVEDEEDKVNAFLDKAMKRRPEGADVEKTDVADYDGVVMRTESYYRYLTSMQLGKMAEYGGMMIERQEETVGEVRGLRGEFKDYREEFRDFARRTDGNSRLISERYGEISDKLTVILETLIRESGETRVMLNETMKALREAIDRLSKRGHPYKWLGATILNRWARFFSMERDLT